MLVTAVKTGQGAPQGQRPSAYEVRGAAAALLAELAQREQYKDEILAAELVPHLLVLLDGRLKDEGGLMQLFSRLRHLLGLDLVFLLLWALQAQWTGLFLLSLWECTQQHRRNMSTT